MICICGNEPMAQGFYASDIEGNEVMPDDNWADLYTCDNCGRVANGKTLEVVGQRKHETSEA